MSRAAFFIFLVASLLQAFSQSPVRISGISEPPELTGEPKKWPLPSESDRQLMALMDRWNERDIEKNRAVRPEFDNFIIKYPDYPDAYAVRAIGDLCYLKNKNYTQIRN